MRTRPGPLVFLGAVVLIAGLIFMIPGRLVNGSASAAVSTLASTGAAVSTMASTGAAISTLASTGAVVSTPAPSATTTLPEIADRVRIMNTIQALSTLSDGSTPRSRFAFNVDMDSIGVWIENRLAVAMGPGGVRASTERVGFAAEPDTTQTCQKWDAAVPRRSTLYDIVGTLRGAAPGAGMFIISAHYDGTACRTPGWRPWRDAAPAADDNASGTAAVLELARLLSADAPYPFDIRFVLFDGEEEGLLGSKFLAERYRTAGEHILGVLNMDMIGYNPRVDSLVVMTNRSSNFIAHYLLDSEARDPQPDFTFVPEIANLDYSDHAPFWHVNYPAILLIENVQIVVHNPHYHRVSDTVTDDVSRQGLLVAKSANVILKSLRRLAADAAGAPKLHMSDADIFVTVGGASSPIPAVPGDTVKIYAGAFNAGGDFPEGYSQEIRLYRVTDSGRELLATQDVAAPFRTGEHVTLIHSLVAGDSDAGAITIEAETGEGATLEKARRSVPVRAGVERVVRSYVAPNPVRDPARAGLCYELSSDGGVRITLFDLHGDIVGDRRLVLDGRPVPGGGLATGLNRVPLRELFFGGEIAPGIYLYRIEIFDQAGLPGVAGTGKFAVIR